MKRLATIALASILSLVTLLPALGQQPAAYTERFDGTPTTPQPWQNPNNWDIVRLGFDSRIGPLDPNRQLNNVAGHGPNCETPGFPFTTSNVHRLTGPQDMVFLCGTDDGTHLMTATGITGYGALYMTPPIVGDFSAGTTMLEIDMSTLRTSSRDWVQWVLTPPDGGHELAFINTDQHRPPNAIKIELGGANTFVLKQRVDGVEYQIPQDLATTFDQVLARQPSPLTTSMSRRDKFRAIISRDRISFCMPQYSFCWASAAPLPRPLDPAIWHDHVRWQINHVSYNAMKSCEQEALNAGFTEAQILDEFNIVNNQWTRDHCPPVTWHWDNLNVSPYIPFTIIPSVPADFDVTSTSPTTVNFAAPAPPGAHLSFLVWGDTPQLRVSVDGGATWVIPNLQPAESPNNQDVGEQVYQLVSPGLQSIMVRGASSWVRYYAYAFKIEGPPGGTPPPILATPTPTAPPTATPTPSPSPSPSPTSPAATPTPTPTPAPAPAKVCGANISIRNGELVIEPTPCPVARVDDAYWE